MKIIFMGTPEFACPTLENLINNKEFEIVAIYTREPTYANRGQKITKSPIHELALKNNLKVITPKTLKNLEIQQEFNNFNADLAIVVAYGLILPKEILNAPKFGCINLHPSLLPKWRGASPIQRPIINGDKETGVCIIQMDEGLDSGDILNQQNIEITQEDDLGTLSKKLSEIGSNLITKTIKEIKDSTVKKRPQNHSLATYASKIDKSECKLNFNDSTINIHNKIRGLSGSLSAFFEYDGEKIKIYKSKIISQDAKTHKVGEIIDDNFTIQCQSGHIRPLIIHRQNKKAMELKEFLLGFKNFKGKILK